MAAVLGAHRLGRPLALTTSGTTGAGARRVLRSTASWWESFAAYSTLSGVRVGARVWIPGPLAGTMNLYAAVHARVVAATVVESSRSCTHACLTPAQLGRHGAELSAGTTVVVAGDVLPGTLAGQATRAGLRLAHYYGAAELSFVAAGPDAAHLVAFPGVQIQVRGGEIWVRSPYLSQGYLGTPGPLRRENGWATVGDLGRLDGDRLVVTGRPDAIVTAGATVVLAEVEAELATVAAAPLALVGLPHPTLGTVLTAVLTDPADRAALERHARSQLSASHRPRLWRVRSRLPLTAAGKIDRATLIREL